MIHNMDTVINQLEEQEWREFQLLDIMIILVVEFEFIMVIKL